MKAIIFGPPGAGKGTYASRLHAKLGLTVIATGDIFRELLKRDTPLGVKVKGYVEKGLLVPDEVVIEVVKHRLTTIAPSKGFLFDGYPRTLDQAKALETVTDINVIIQLVVPEWILIERLSARRTCAKCDEIYNIRYLKPAVDNICDKCGGSLYQRSDDTPDVIKKRIEVYETQTQPILQYYRKKGTPFIAVKCDNIDYPPQKVVQTILKEAQKMRLI